jgi:hypothetical protein
VKVGSVEVVAILWICSLVVCYVEGLFELEVVVFLSITAVEKSDPSLPSEESHHHDV